MHVPSPNRNYFPQRQSNRITPLIDGNAWFNSIASALDNATSRVYVSVSFFTPQFRFPDSGVDFWEKLNECALRGVDVRVIFWRPVGNNPLFQGVFANVKENREMLLNRNVRFAMRWDSSPDSNHCHHQKDWVIDNAAFIGGIVLGGPLWLTDPGHEDAARFPRGGQQKHDLGVKVEGPCVGDVACHFSERWNECDAGSSFPDSSVANDMDCMQTSVLYDSPQFEHFPRPSSSSVAQVQRSHRWLSGGHAIGKQYELAIHAARHTIYIENQHFCHPRTMEALLLALDRNVRVVAIVPGFQWDEHINNPLLKVLAQWCVGPRLGICLAFLDALRRWCTGKRPSAYRRSFCTLLPLFTKHARSGRFCIAGLRHPTHDKHSVNDLPSIYVHSKLLIVDDEWFTIGSANMVDLSFDNDHTELNISVWDARVANLLRRKLMQEHMLRMDVDECYYNSPNDNMKAEFDEFIACARRHEGLAYSMDPGVYGAVLFVYSLAIEQPLSLDRN